MEGHRCGRLKTGKGGGGGARRDGRGGWVGGYGLESHMEEGGVRGGRWPWWEREGWRGESLLLHPPLVVAAPSVARGCMTFFMVVAAVDLVGRVAE